jgi:hypothetical protein
MNKECICDICDKKYASASSLCNHKKLIHKKIKENIKIIKCNYCNKEFTRNFNKLRHIKICKDKEEFEKKENSEKLKLEIKLEELKFKNQKIEMEKLKNQKIEILKLKHYSYKNNEVNEEKNINGFIYIIHEREFIKSKENIYKIGRTENIIERIKKYPKNSCYCFVRKSNNMFIDENKLIKLFKQIFNHLKEYGNEYFEGDIDNMIKIINNYFDNINNDNDDNIIKNINL